MIVILGFDGLEYEYVKEFGCEDLMQDSFGRTDISEFAEPRTVVIWSSFLAGKNLERRILALGKKNLWNFKLSPEETFFHGRKWRAVDVPGLTYDMKMHEEERKLLKAFFEKECTVEEYDRVVFENHKKVKEEFFRELKKKYEILMGYFSIADSVGHLSFGIKSKMKLIYEELEKIAKKVRERKEKVLIISDHGMRAVGRFGDHTNHGFWSLNLDAELGTPAITAFRKIIENMIQGH